MEINKTENEMSKYFRQPVYFFISRFWFISCHSLSSTWFLREIVYVGLKMLSRTAAAWCNGTETTLHKYFLHFIHLISPTSQLHFLLFLFPFIINQPGVFLHTDLWAKFLCICIFSHRYCEQNNHVRWNLHSLSAPVLNWAFYCVWCKLAEVH